MEATDAHPVVAVKLTRAIIAPPLAAATLVLATVIALRLLGRVWWCACGTPTLFVADPATMHNSQHLFDWYSFSHVLHGVIFCGALWPLQKKVGLGWRLTIAMAIEAAWEIVENSPWIIDRYRNATAAVGYEGDSIVNSVGDLLFCVIGFFLAKWLGWRWSIVLFVVLELTMLAFIRDNLTLNVLMLLWPIESVREWQAGTLAVWL